MENQHTNAQALKSSLSIANEERREVDVEAIETATRILLAALGEDVNRSGLKETPARVARFYREFIEYDAGGLSTLFETEAYGQLITLTGIQVASLCEHHLLPFTCKVAVAYYPAKETLGLSKFARIAQAAAHRLNTQERLTRIIRDTVAEITGAHSVLVVTSDASHACMSIRGVEELHARTQVVDSLGLFYNADSERDYALRMIRTASE